MSLKERILQLIEKEGLNPNQFYLKTGLANGFLNTIGARLQKPSIEKISKAFPHWNIDWLMTGEGKMLKSDEKESPPDVPRISYTEGVPYYDVDFIGGFDLVMNDQTTAPAYNIDFATSSNRLFNSVSSDKSDFHITAVIISPV